MFPYQIGITATIAFLYLSADCLDIGSEIIGGKDVKPNSKPWMASIQIGNSHICGGVLIKDQWVLTAAHCSKLKGEKTVVLGAHNLKKEEKSQERLKIEKTVIYPGFDKDPKSKDIMLIKGDSGGPLICKSTFRAIVSGGNNCGNPEKPGVYTFLSDEYLPWISKTIQANANITK
ncbi:granzyme K-like [Acipenser oxyrinchus oxyrinchus]|uniref:trypsin n=1 Tax=Acipenser oxyrinchus oxyrinchus TaxID=40147 RepID=A0AAD8LVR6_ACIOX|nr:granzyme K-like [Acipenser oxyrinchus oxyrinchus]